MAISSIWTRIKCLAGRHDLILTQEFVFKYVENSKRTACRQCGYMQFETMHDGEQVITAWSSAYHDLYEKYGHQVIYQPWEGGKP